MLMTALVGIHRYRTGASDVLRIFPSAFFAAGIGLVVLWMHSRSAVVVSADSFSYLVGGPRWLVAEAR